jgi:hypothetical protein
MLAAGIDTGRDLEPAPPDDPAELPIEFEIA